MSAAVQEPAIATCPCCGGSVRLNGSRMEIVKLTKPTTPWRPGGLMWQARHRRMQTLRKAGLSFTAISRVMALEGLSLDEERIRRILNGTVTQRTMRRHLS